jgi:hypothetical protein
MIGNGKNAGGLMYESHSNTVRSPSGSTVPFEGNPQDRTVSLLAISFMPYGSYA